MSVHHRPRSAWAIVTPGVYPSIILSSSILTRNARLGFSILRTLALVGLLLLSIALTLRHIVLAPDHIDIPFDWQTFTLATQRLDGSSLYAWEFRGSFEYSYRYSPLFAYLMVPFVALGLTVWRLLHMAVLLLLPWKVALLTLLAWPFWEDVYHANVMTFAFVLGWLAFQGSRWATAGYLVLALLIPRPLMVPLVAWLLWKRPEWRVPALVMSIVFVGLTVATGEAGPFVGTLLRSDDMVEFARNFGPSRTMGLWWLIIGLPLGIWLTWKGRVGWASLALSPYLLPYHFLMGMLETARRGPNDRSPERGTRSSLAASLWRWLRGRQRRPEPVT